MTAPIPKRAQRTNAVYLTVLERDLVVSALDCLHEHLRTSGTGDGDQCVKFSKSFTRQRLLDAKRLFTDNK